MNRRIMRLDEIKRSDLRSLPFTLNGKGLSRSSVCLVRDTISGPLSYAVDEEIISTNPATGLVKRLQLERDKKGCIEPLTHEEVKTFLETCQKSFPEYHPFFLCAFRTGMRLGELLALQWGDVDWNSGFIRVSRSYKVGRFSATKTGKARRVDMSDQLFASLKALHTRRKEEALREGKAVMELIFHRQGKPMEQNFVRELFKRMLKRAGL